MALIEQAEPLTQARQQPCRHGCVTEIESDALPPGLDAGTACAISLRKREPAFILRWRLKALERWMSMAPPNGGQLRISSIDSQAP